MTDTAAAKAPSAPKTAKHARFLAETARKRAEKLRAQAYDADRAADNYDRMAELLPEASAYAPKANVVYEPGTVVHFRYGRTTATSQARELVGVIKGRRDNEAGVPQAYRVEAGEGFDAYVYAVRPGAIKGTQADAEAGIDNPAAE